MGKGKSKNVITLTPDGRKIDYYATNEKSLVEIALSKDPNTSDRKKRIKVKKPTVWEEVKRKAGRIKRKLGG